MFVNYISYLPSISFFSAIKNCENLYINNNILYNKSKHFNRCKIISSQGPLILTIPLDNGRNQKNIYNNIKISTNYNWNKQHLKTIISCYNNSPWFEFYKDEIVELYLSKNIFLNDLNLMFFKWCLEKLNIKCNVIFLKDDNIEKKDNFLENEINNINKDFIKYNQTFENKLGFIKNCSIIDLIFNEGKKSCNYL